MMIANIWGQGQLFAFSALDGNSYESDDFVGYLSGDRIGVKFVANVRRELAIVMTSALQPEFNVVTGDCLCAETNNGKSINIVYADAHLIIGNTPGDSCAVVFVEGRFEKNCKDGAEIHDTNDGEYTALLTDGNKFAFAYGKSVFDALNLVKKGINMDVSSEVNKKLEYYRKHTLDENNKYAQLYSKCISVMKNQLYSSEGIFKRIWSTPDRLPHKYLWLWDSVFHSVGHRNIDTELAENLILAILDTQKQNGFIPHMSGADEEVTSNITQPPIIAWGAYKVYEKSRNKEFLKTVFESNKRFLAWCQSNRRDTDEELDTWFTSDNVNCRCGESGMDNSPRFDIHSRLQAIDFSCFMANDTKNMKKIAEELNDCDSAEFYGKWHEEIKKCINCKLWDEETEFYYDYDTTNKKLSKIMSVASFLPLFSGVCDEEKAKKLVSHLTNPDMFYTEFPIPSIAKNDPTFGTDMWRGPVWLNYNYMIIEGLANYNYDNIADDITKKMIDTVNNWYKCTGSVFEFYDSENKLVPSRFNRKGATIEPYDFMARYQSIKDYGWSCALVFDILHNIFAKNS